MKGVKAEGSVLAVMYTSLLLDQMGIKSRFVGKKKRY